jgi:RimJ/RimL family protein N-acetyltransferase
VIPVELRSERLLLSIPSGDADIEAIARFCQDPLFEQYLTTPWPYTRDDAVAFVDRFVPERWADDSEYSWAIRSEHGALLGMMGWRTRGDLGFWMGAEHRGNGYTVEALAAVVEWVFAEPVVDGRAVERIDWETLPGNYASARVARAAGFHFTGLAPVRIPARDGSHPDSWHGLLLRDDDRSIKDGWPL